jgi:hypothetical protein
MMIERDFTGTPFAAAEIGDRTAPAQGATQPRSRWSRKVAADLVGLGDMLVLVATMMASAVWISNGQAPHGTGLDLPEGGGQARDTRTFPHHLVLTARRALSLAKRDPAP